MIVSPIIGTLWVQLIYYRKLSSQSYGLLRVFMIYNSMSLINLAINVIIELTRNEPNQITLLLEAVEFVVKLIISFASTRTISMNTKLNKLSRKS